MLQHEAFLDLMQTKLSGLGLTLNSDIEEVRLQLRLVRSAAYIWGGINYNADNVYLMMQGTSQAMYASDSERVGSSTTDYEVFHQGFADTRAERWFLVPGVTGTMFKNEKYPAHPWLHASASLRTPRTTSTSTRRPTATR